MIHLPLLLVLQPSMQVQRYQCPIQLLTKLTLNKKKKYLVSSVDFSCPASDPLPLHSYLILKVTDLSL